MALTHRWQPALTLAVSRDAIALRLKLLMTVLLCCLTCSLQGDKPPEPLPRTVCEPDVALGVMELQQLGLVPLLMQQHGVVA